MTDKEVFKSMRDDIVEAKSRLEVQTSQHGVAALTTALTQANAALLLALTEPTDDAPAGVLPPEISRELLGQVVDEVFRRRHRGRHRDRGHLPGDCAQRRPPPRTGGLEP